MKLFWAVSYFYEPMNSSTTNTAKLSKSFQKPYRIIIILIVTRKKLRIL